MSTSRIALRISRRALAAVSLRDDELVFHDGRHLSSQADRARRAVERYLAQVVDLTKPDIVTLDAPTKDSSLASDLAVAVRTALAERHIEVENVTVSDVLASYGLPGLRTRTELRAVVEPFWPDVAGMKGKVKPYVLEAAAVALYADIRAGLGVPDEP